jgi:hypothetical protein
MLLEGGGQIISTAFLRPPYNRRVPLRVFLAVLRHPTLWGEAVRAARALGCKEWQFRLLLVPPPERVYLKWRIATAYGSPDAVLEPDDVIAYLRWRQRHRQI